MILVIGLHVVGLLFWLWRRKQASKQDGRRWAILPINGFCATSYDLDEMSKQQATRLAIELKDCLDRLWSPLSDHYGVWPKPYLAKLTFDGQTADPKTGKPKPIYFRTGPMVIRMRPPGFAVKGVVNRSPKEWFTREAHNVFRYYAFGMEELYLSDDAPFHEVESWQQANLICIAASK